MLLVPNELMALMAFVFFHVPALFKKSKRRSNYGTECIYKGINTSELRRTT
jgi:hypothetical protein